MDYLGYHNDSSLVESSIHMLAISKNTIVLDQLKHSIDSDAVCLLATRSRRQGLQILKKHPYIQAIFLDFQLLSDPIYRLADTIKQITQPFDLPKIICAGEHNNFEQVCTAMRSGATDYLSVPPNKHELKACIERTVLSADNNRIYLRHLEKIERHIDQLQEVLQSIQHQYSEPQGASQQTHQTMSEVRDGEHPNPYMQKLIALTRLQEHKKTFDALPHFMSTGWVILLEIFKTELSGRSAYVTTIALGSSVPASSAHRHLATLEAHQLIRRSQDIADKRRILVQLTDKARTQILSFFDHI